MKFIKIIINKYRYKSKRKIQSECKHTFKFYKVSNINGAFSLICTKCGYIDYGKRG